MCQKFSPLWLSIHIYTTVSLAVIRLKSEADHFSSRYMELSEHDFYLNPISIGLLLLAIVTLWLYKRQGRTKLPPGPWHIPFIGSAWELKADPDLRKSLRRLHKQYGDIYRLYMGPRLAVVISGYESIKEVFVKRGGEFSDRPDTLLTTLIGEKQGIVSSSGELWKEHRKFTLATLRNFGFGKTSLEGKIHTEVSILLSEIAKQHEKPFRVQHLVQTSVSNVINAMAFGGHFNHNDPRFAKMMKMIDENFENNGPNAVVAFFPFLRYLPGDLFRVKKTLRNVKCVQGFIGDLIDKHIENFDENKLEDFVDAFLLEMKRNGDQKDSTFTKRQLIRTVSDLFVAGTETTTTTITWAVLYLAVKQDIQARVFREINDIVGTGRLPSLQDKRNLVYTEAFIMEILRVCNIATISLPHTCTVNTKLRDYDIPKGTTLLPDIDSVLFDPKIWGDPEEFRPERFISEEGILLKPEEFIPFFTGRRNCVGESLARMELYLFVTALVQRLELLPPEGTTLDINEIDGLFGMTHKPKPFEIRAILRKE
ncbi:hypothetical protein CHS0354_036936 [Potamilus streckersoni]|uniref:Cytochrome P450 n=1 Tax=Potamilus streckersoni TaxID=2493646 RepID=A0AAE0VZY3_9BIVA|nr:hypothetical protein CHS0354_036936 [Potamilus streckersoni]